MGSLYAEWVVLHQKPIALNLVYAFMAPLLLGAWLTIPADLTSAGQHIIALYKEWKSAPK
jgi:hypothetical protein